MNIENNAEKERDTSQYGAGRPQETVGKETSSKSVEQMPLTLRSIICPQHGHLLLPSGISEFLNGNGCWVTLILLLSG